jgi:hypothetical protein
MAMMGAVCANCVFTDLYPTQSAAACLQQIKHSESKLIICDTVQTYVERYLPNEEALAELGIKHAVLFSEFGPIQHP